MSKVKLNIQKSGDLLNIEYDGTSQELAALLSITAEMVSGVKVAVLLAASMIVEEGDRQLGDKIATHAVTNLLSHNSIGNIADA
ncbi:MAG: hypothetical protein WAS72_05755 [Saprospiraceae bacterium]